MNRSCKVFYECFMKTHYQTEGINPEEYRNPEDAIEDYYEANNGDIEATKGEIMRLFREKPITTEYKLEELPF